TGNRQVDGCTGCTYPCRVAKPAEPYPLGTSRNTARSRAPHTGPMERGGDFPTERVKSDKRPRRRTGQGVPYLSAPERDQRIVELRRRGWTYKRVGRAVSRAAIAASSAGVAAVAIAIC